MMLADRNFAADTPTAGDPYSYYGRIVSRGAPWPEAVPCLPPLVVLVPVMLLLVRICLRTQHWFGPAQLKET